MAVAPSHPAEARASLSGLRGILDQLDEPAAGAQMHALLRELFPIPRSITGEGLRETFRQLSRHVPLAMTEVPSGTAVFDWTVPREWNVREAWVKAPDGQKVADYSRSNLELVGYSVPFRGRLTLDQLRPRLHSLPDQPSRIPYRTSYYKDDWGFCLTHDRLLALPAGEYEVVIDSSLENGSLTYAEAVLRGALDQEVLVSSHCCHPSLGNDNLSGVVVALFLSRALSGLRTRYTYRFVFAPVTIGAVTWLAKNDARAPSIRHGLVLAGVGDAGPLTYKKTRRGNTVIDRAAALVLKHAGVPFSTRDFSPYGYDERQFCSPGFDLAVGALSRTPFGEYPEYHTSGDDADFVRPASLAQTYRRCLELFEVLEGNLAYQNLSPKCEPQLGKRGLYGSVGGSSHSFADQMALLWVLNLSDGEHDLVEVAERSGIPFAKIGAAARSLEKAGLLRPVEEKSS